METESIDLHHFIIDDKMFEEMYNFCGVDDESEEECRPADRTAALPGVVLAEEVSANGSINNRDVEMAGNIFRSIGNPGCRLRCSSSSQIRTQRATTKSSSGGS
jgi:hypothetical protein